MASVNVHLRFNLQNYIISNDGFDVQEVVFGMEKYERPVMEIEVVEDDVILTSGQIEKPK